jgi:head-tail adaptor
MIDPGRLDQRLVIVAPTDTPDGAGGVTRTYADAETVWAQIEPLSAKADASDDSVGAVVRYRITLRAGPDITMAHLLRRGTQTFLIDGVQPDAIDAHLLVVEAHESLA